MTVLNHDFMRTFLAVVDAGSFRAAASRVHRTPSAISMQMARLEGEVGRPLFVKNGRTVALSATGEELLTYARRIIDLCDEAVEHLRGREIDGQVRFGMPDERGARLLPRVMARFARVYPNVEVTIVLDSSRRLLDRLARGEVDVVVVSDMPHAAAHGGEVVHGDELVWVGCVDGRAKGLDPLPLALSELGCQWRHHAVEALVGAGRAYRIAVTCDHSWGQLAAVHADLAISVLPTALLCDTVERIDGVLPPLPSFTDRMCVGPNPSRAALALAEALRESLH
ncbi:LysR substrate-binding domain-containing protein [Acuticoccus sp.]|uniref:LysR substrate-binding domain-containing protein n=1 Tax=Acuticoccus sp. TaxID=1904378 RepID=UPI003B530418